LAPKKITGKRYKKETKVLNLQFNFLFLLGFLGCQTEDRKRERQTLQRSSRVLGGEPSRAVFRASTGLYLNGERIKQLRFLAKIKELSGFRENYTQKRKNRI